MKDVPRIMYYDEKYNVSDAEKQVLRQTERHIEEQQRLTGAADQRAVAFAAVQIVVIGILFSNNTSSIIEESKVVVVLLLILSVATAIYSARPTRIYGSGSDAKALKDYRQTPNHHYLCSTLIERNERNIQHNDGVLKRSALMFRISLIASLISVAVAINDWLDVIK